MPSADSESPDEAFFNDLSQQGPDANENSPRANGGEARKDDATSKQKRIACVLCRKRKLRCDGTRPACGTCKRLSHDCTYDEVRKKSGPKRGYVKLLEARLQQVETLLKNQETTEPPKEPSRQDSTTAYVASTAQQPLPNSNEYLGAPDAAPRISPAPDAFPKSTANGMSPEGEFQWEMIGLGLDEPLPPQDVQDELYQIYFAKIHPSIPIIHRPRFMAAMDLAPHMRPPVCLRYAMWTVAASVADKYDALQEHFYQRARKYAQSDEMKGHGEGTITLAHCQAWSLVSTYEFKQMYFPRAWLSSGRATRLAQMMQLHRLDGVGLDVKQCLPPPKDWTEREERRRTFWMSFNIDRYASIGTGWPMTFDERDILTNLPSSDEAFEKSKPMPTGSLEQALGSNGIGNLQSFGGIVLTAALFGRNLLHLHRPGSDDNDDDLNGGFWTRHRAIEGILLQTSLGLPDHLRLPSGSTDPNTVFLHMCIHTSTICLHQAAIFKADKYRLPITVSYESKIRCVTAAAEIASIMRMVSHLDLSAMNPFISFCVYVAARVFVQYLKTRPTDQQMQASLQFLLAAMQALRRKNPLTESFLVQLDLDLESAGVPGLQQNPYKQPQTRGTDGVIPVNSDPVGCSPIFEIRDTQNPSNPINQYGNGEPARPAVPYPIERMTGPFHHAHVTSISPGAQNLDRQNTHWIPASSNTYGMSADATTEMDLSPEANDDQPSPATTTSNTRSHSLPHSGNNSSSHSSYSPGQPTDQMPYRPSPRMGTQTAPAPNNPISNPISSSSALNNNIFYQTSNDIMNPDFFSSAPPPMPPLAGPGGDLDFSMGTVGNDWGGVGMGVGGMGVGAGLTEMSDGQWNAMLENMNMGWDSVGPPHAGDALR
ncbi:hypothetical protein BU23DRAFT_602051 [Bimuria novae-zelandiae CBS 107.79]|uniref:Zn(2)-C6 fungal-type domain-containing protein n=1 Tax=Bimuria novae-zelandiae CBS 107.79 TaxID=1447943 RepID=A0A6A5UV27_9PLEO|nr:hypothetical protein BU23DRAFT_602051 [Bimuria novae-zelandiae CBS 107.79]